MSINSERKGSRAIVRNLRFAQECIQKLRDAHRAVVLRQLPIVRLVRAILSSAQLEFRGDRAVIVYQFNATPDQHAQLLRWASGIEPQVDEAMELIQQNDLLVGRIREENRRLQEKLWKIAQASEINKQ